MYLVSLPLGERFIVAKGRGGEALKLGLLSLNLSEGRVTEQLNPMHKLA